VKIKIRATGSLVELVGDEGGDMEGTLELFQTACRRAMEEEIKACVKKAKDLNADIFGFGEKFQRYLPDDWENDMKDEWKIIFPQLKVDLSVDLKLLDTGKLNMRVRREMN
jgi:hypothetical protein